MTVKEVIDIVNSKEFYSIYDVEDYLLDEYNVELKKLESKIDRTPGWLYETSITAYQCDDGIVGIEGISHISDRIDWEDCDYPSTAFEMEEYYKLSYRIKTLKNKSNNES